MGSQAWDEMLAAQSGTGVNRQRLLDQIATSIQMQQYYSSNAGTNRDMMNAATQEQHKQEKLKSLLSLVGGGSNGLDGANGGSGGWVNPFGGYGGGAGGSVSASGAGGAAGGSGVPQLSNDNRFATGLGDAELRIKNLLDNPDSIQQSAAYKFRVGGGQEALQRALGAKGLLNSGNRLTELTKYGQDMASQEYDNQYDRLGSLLGNYSTGYVADKNANTNRFAAQANAWNTAQGNQNQLAIADKEIWNKRNPAQIPGINNGFKWV